jgi:hypothetical protein
MTVTGRKCATDKLLEEKALNYIKTKTSEKNVCCTTRKTIEAVSILRILLYMGGIMSV